MATTQPTDFSDSDEIEPLNDREQRALTEHMDIYEDDPAAGPTEVAVYNDGARYIVSPATDFCTCKFRQFNPGETCKHAYRVQFETTRDIPSWVQPDALDDWLSADAQPVMADGGMVSERDSLETERVNGGVLVWDRDIDKPGRMLAGFSDVTDWDAIRSELVKRGIGVGAIHHKEVYDPAEVGL
jgi:hypothetical protein